jgi:hypothetical protein
MCKQIESLKILRIRGQESHRFFETQDSLIMIQNKPFESFGFAIPIFWMSGFVVTI